MFLFGLLRYHYSGCVCRLVSFRREDNDNHRSCEPASCDAPSKAGRALHARLSIALDDPMEILQESTQGKRKTTMNQNANDTANRKVVSQKEKLQVIIIFRKVEQEGS